MNGGCRPFILILCHTCACTLIHYFLHNTFLIITYTIILLAVL